MADEKQRSKLWPGAGIDLMAAAGVVCITAGCLMVSVPLALIVCGGLMLTGAAAAARRGA